MAPEGQCSNMLVYIFERFETKCDKLRELNFIIFIPDEITAYQFIDGSGLKLRNRES